MTRHRVVYVTSSRYKMEEIDVFYDCVDDAGRKFRDRVEFEIRQLTIKETLEVDLSLMVAAEAAAAYERTKVPSLVEHAGLVFDGHAAFPGGLTKPMWDELGDRFVVANGMVDRGATAKAVVGYCDGVSTRTFVGETHGTLVDPPRGDRKFYWDRVFVPDGGSGITYAEIVEANGIAAKLQGFSQSAKAMRKFVEFIEEAGVSDFWV